MADLDSIDYEDKHYRRRKADLEERLYKTYDKIEEMEVALVAAKANQRFLRFWKKNGCVFLFSQSGYEGIDIPRG